MDSVGAGGDRTVYGGARCVDRKCGIAVDRDST